LGQKRTLAACPRNVRFAPKTDFAGLPSAAHHPGAAMQGAVFFRFPYALAVRPYVQALPVKIIPNLPRLAHLWPIQALARQLLRRTTDDGIGVLRLVGQCRR